MRVVSRVNEEGMAQLRANFDRFEELLQDNVSDVLERHGESAVERMQDNHQADAHAIQRYINRTWNLTTSITTELHPWVNQFVQLELRADAPYAFDIENGTPRNQPYPFFWQEVYQLEADIMPDLQQALDEAVLAITEQGS